MEVFKKIVGWTAVSVGLVTALVGLDSFDGQSLGVDVAKLYGVQPEVVPDIALKTTLIGVLGILSGNAVLAKSK